MQQINAAQLLQCKLCRTPLRTSSNARQRQMKSHPVRCEASHELPHSLQQGVSRRSLLQSMSLLLLPAAPSYAQEAGPTAQLAAADTAQTASTALSGIPAVLEGEAKQAVEQALRKSVEKNKAPVVLRLVFHDSGTYSAAARDGGANASIQHELDRPENFGLKRGWKVIQTAMTNIKGTPAEGLVSWADMIALVGAYAVAMCGGPSISIPIGRLDAKQADPINRLPAESYSADQLKQAFEGQGLSVQEFVALAGAHTLGSKGFGDPLTFDNAYYTALLQKPWAAPNADSMAQMIGLPSDHVLPDDADCKPVIKMYAADQSSFFKDFAAAYQKLTMLGAQWRPIAAA